jgi:3,4-dihydroxy 2-butanone 4-phosphate synthase/GTP cyclohydrolase II
MEMQDLRIERRVCARIPTQEGEFRLCLYTTNRDDKEHLALLFGEVKDKYNVLVRVHSECFTGDVLGSQRCDCGEQLHLAIRRIAENGSGVLIYLRQEGRGIGLLDKLRAYNLQDIGYDTVDANLILGHQADEREYSVAAAILEDLGVRSIRLLTNNPSKIKYLRGLGLPVVAREALESTITAENADYLQTKVQRMNHLLNLSSLPLATLRGGNGSGNGTH